MLARFKMVFIPVALLGSLLPSAVLALGLGELTIKSGLDEPLDASIELLELDGLAQEDILVTLGSQEDFDQANLERSGSIDRIQLDVQLDSATEGTLVLSTTGAVTEPSLSLVLNVSWPAGSLLREVTLLIDVPTFTENTPVTPAPPQASINAPNTIAVESGDTLWEIAQRARSDNDISVQQMMLALQSANSTAFIDNNINRVRAGSVLRIPSREDILALSQESAVLEIQVQNTTLALDSANLSAGNNAVSANAGEGDELSVLTNTDVDVESDDALSREIANLENELGLSEESLDRAKIENEELSSQLVTLPTQTSSLSVPSPMAVG